MKTVSNIPSSNNWKRINLQLASLAGGLALATAALLGSGEILRDQAATDTASAPVFVESRPIGPVMDEPDFGSVAADSTAFQQPQAAPQVIGLVMPEPDFGSVPADYTALRPSTEGQSERSIIDPHFGTGPESVSAVEADD